MAGKVKAAYKCYAGVGARDLPEDVAEVMTDLADQLEDMGYILRTGGASGSDEAFIDGVKDTNNVELYLPWQGYNGYESSFHTPTTGALEIAFINHPNWTKCKDSVRKLHARNSHIVMGPNVYPGEVIDFMICYTPKGECVGGTGQAIRVADYALAPVFNLGLGIDYTLGEIERFLEKQSK